MSDVYCFAGCHVWIGASSLCMCQERLASLVAMYGLMVPYNPYSPHAPQKPPEVPQERLQAAQEAGARWLSADGQRAYCERYVVILQAEWDGIEFGGWWEAEGLPVDAVVLG